MGILQQLTDERFQISLADSLIWQSQKTDLVASASDDFSVSYTKAQRLTAHAPHPAPERGGNAPVTPGADRVPGLRIQSARRTA